MARSRYQHGNITLRRYAHRDLAGVRDLFARVNRLLAPKDKRQDFETYIANSLRDEIDQIPDYYKFRQGAFWVAEDRNRLVGMFGLETVAPGVMELRRMYVDPDMGRRGIAAFMLQQAEAYCRENGIERLDLSTSELQTEALEFYRNAGYAARGEQIAEKPSNKTVGGGIRRFHFSKSFRR